MQQLAAVLIIVGGPALASGPALSSLSGGDEVRGLGSDVGPVEHAWAAPVPAPQLKTTLWTDEMERRWIVMPAGLLTILTVAAAAIYNARFDPLPPDTTVDRVVVEKSSRRLVVFREGEALKSYSVALGREPVGVKQFEGDGKTPEGSYTIDWRKEDSSFHLALHVSYPQPPHVAEAAAAGKSPGGAIMIHGIRNGLGFVGPLHRMYDWTDGCVAVTNAEIEELWAAVPNGTPIEIRP